MYLCIHVAMYLYSQTKLSLKSIHRHIHTFINGLEDFSQKIYMYTCIHSYISTSIHPHIDTFIHRCNHVTKKTFPKAYMYDTYARMSCIQIYIYTSLQNPTKKALYQSRELFLFTAF